MKDWESHLEESLNAVQEAHKQAMEELRALSEQWRNGKKSGELRKMLPELIWKDRPDRMLTPFLHLGKPRHTFEVRADGTIEVRIRKGATELVQLFSNEDDLKNRNPDLYEKYADVMHADDE